MRWSGFADNEPIPRRLTELAAEVVRQGQVELALAWLWSSRTREPSPQVPRNLLRSLMYVERHRGEQIEPGYSARQYFEDCLRLALRDARPVEALRSSFRSRRGDVRRKPSGSTSH